MTSETGSGGSQQTVLVDAVDDELDRADDAELSERCIALTADGTRCSNARTHMTNDPFCGPHSRADDVEVIDDAE